LFSKNFSPHVNVEGEEGFETRAQFHQRSTYSFYASGAKKPEKYSQVINLFKLLGFTRPKAARKHVGEIDPSLISE